MPAVRSFKNRLTVVMPSADYRVKYLRQCLHHLNLERFDAGLVVLDFGKDRLDTMGLWSARDSFQTHHVYYGPDVPYFERMQDGARRVETPFVLLYPDDDFMFFDVMEKCVDLLESDPGYSVAQGKALRFVDERQPIAFNPYQKLPIEDDTAFVRFLHLFRTYNHHIYVVQRRESLLRKMTLGDRFRNDVMFWQYFDAAVSVIEGKAAVFPSIGMIRRIHKLGLGRQQAANRDPTAFPHLILADDFTDKFRFFRQQLQELLTEAGIAFDERKTQQIEDACLSIVRWGLCQLRAQESDRQFLPELLRTNPAEKAKLQSVVDCIKSDAIRSSPGAPVAS